MARFKLTLYRPVAPGRHPQQRGLSIAELLVAIAMVAIALLAIIAMFTQGFFMLSQSKQLGSATERGQQCLENIKANGVAFVSLGRFDSRAGDLPNETTGFPPPPYPTSTSGTSNDMVVEASNTITPAGTIAVTVQVYYEDNKKMELQTYLNQ